MTNRRLKLVALALPLFACGPSPSSAPDAAPQTGIKIFSWWTAPGEAEALDALITAHREQHPGVAISNLVVSNIGQDPEQRLRGLLFGVDGDPPNPPDLMQWNVDSFKSKWIDSGAKFEPLDRVFAEEGWGDKFRPDILADCTVDGRIVALPVGIHRQNTLMYNKQLLTDANASVPVDWASFVDACDRVKALGKTCVAATQESWVQDILLRNVAIMTMGADGYHAYFTGAGTKDDAMIDTVVTNFELVLDQYVGGRDSMRASGWDEAAKDLFRGTTLFFMHGDWAVGLYKTLGWNDQDFAAIATPGARSLFVYNTDAFLIPEGETDLEARLDVIRSWGRADALAAFASAKGASPPRTDVVVTNDPVAAAVYADLQAATKVMRLPASSVDLVVLQGFVAGTIDKATLVQAIRDAAYAN